MRAHHGERVAEGDGGDAPIGSESSVLPAGQSQLSGILTEHVDILPSSGSKAFPRDFKQGLAQVDQVDFVKVVEG